MRAKDYVYHIHCFTCITCNVPLSKGDQFGMRDGYIYCRHHYELLLTGEYAGAGPVPDFVQFSPTEQIPYIPPVAVGQKGRPRKRKSQHEDMSSLGMGPGLHGGQVTPLLEALAGGPSDMAEVTLHGHEESVSCLSFGGPAGVVVSGFLGGELRLYRPRSGRTTAGGAA
ncbi:LIM/homeobox protein Lhx2-like [Amphibalanus amphitrite]|uniref:LIM/homeobox protein Lhx2-like n=1 Tax=Amphibalanus amphitrite TaxID=1232801 RepID=UPI001C90778D|nr:LIM/homeobox protein Lhx2-like [Amphibalanus amphitrite]